MDYLLATYASSPKSTIDQEVYKEALRLVVEDLQSRGLQVDTRALNAAKLDLVRAIIVFDADSEDLERALEDLQRSNAALYGAKSPEYFELICTRAFYLNNAGNSVKIADGQRLAKGVLSDDALDENQHGSAICSCKLAIGEKVPCPQFDALSD